MMEATLFLPASTNKLIYASQRSNNLLSEKASFGNPSTSSKSTSIFAISVFRSILFKEREDRLGALFFLTTFTDSTLGAVEILSLFFISGTSCLATALISSFTLNLALLFLGDLDLKTTAEIMKGLLFFFYQ
jgi:hypothetical protein